MNATEAATLLAHAAAFDNRRPSEAAAQAWAAALRDVPLDADALEAVAAFYGAAPEPGESGQKWIQPHHVRTCRRAIRDDRLAAVPELAPPGDPADEETYRYALADIRHRVAGGRMPFRAIEGGKARSAGPSKAWRETRSPADADRTLAQTVACPVEWCPARAGEPCRSGPLTAPMTRWHPSRLDSARKTEPAGLEVRDA